ncbi:MAG: PSP1 C-terminal domain-containing protein [Pirellulales bacterium]
MSLHLVRVGALAEIGRFCASDARRYRRGTRVVVQTHRGLEVGTVLTPVDAAMPVDSNKNDAAGNVGDAGHVQHDGTLVRALTVEDELLRARLESRRQQAFDACCDKIAELGLAVTLLDVEQLFDGRSLVFYFLEEPPPELDEALAALAETYEATAELRRFADTLTSGCGPDCGTEAAAGHGCDGCAAGCAVAGACSVRTG